MSLDVNMVGQNFDEIEHVEIVMSDGCILSAKIWMPHAAQTKKLPAIFEYLPYRKRDFTSIRDSRNHRFFAKHEYVCVRVDIRGSGDSEGILEDEYLESEIQDGIEILNWIAKQPWSNGRVGMIGLSWGGFNGLQIAARNPEPLKAIVTVCSSDDRYADDVHYMGGCLLTDNISWASAMFSHNSSPPDPELVGDKWKDMWLERLEHSGLWLKSWLENQTRNDYWRHASVCENYKDIKCPVYAASGWADGYTNSVFRLIENLDVPRKGVVGPWGHKYPHDGTPGTGIGFLHDCLRWWDKWLKDIPNGTEKDPKLQVWLQGSYSPLELQRPGQWVNANWSKQVKRPTKTYQFNASGLALEDSKGKGEDHETYGEIQSPLNVGLFAGKWCSYNAEHDLPSDQRKEDGGSLVLETEPLEEDFEILGAVKVQLELCVDKPEAMICARLADVAPSGRTTRVTYGLLNLNHRKNHSEVVDLIPGKKYKFDVEMNYVAQKFAKGHKIRLSLSSSYWPLAWPSPERVKMKVFYCNSRIILPEFKAPLRGDDANLNQFKEPANQEPAPSEILLPSRRSWKVIHDMSSDEEILEVINDDPKQLLVIPNVVMYRKVSEIYKFSKDDYRTLHAEVDRELSFSRKGWDIKTIAKTTVTSTKEHFRILATLDAYENNGRIFAKSWDEKIPRRGV